MNSLFETELEKYGIIIYGKNSNNKCLSSNDLKRSIKIFNNKDDYKLQRN